jgi:hypothetical protein
MKTVIFHNPGNLDIRGATTMGLSAKGSDDAIGKFGTGLKYAIASICRWGGAVSIETGGEIYEFSTNPIDFRGKAHDQIIMRKRGSGHCQELGYTTHYGSHWQPWQIFRELYSNAKDEGGDVSTAMGRPSGSGTVITVDCKQVAECYAERDTIILPSKGTPTNDCSGFDTHLIKAPSMFLYYRGVRVHKVKCLNTWNLMDCVELTEDRTVNGIYSFESAAGQAIQASTDRDMIFKCLTAGDGFFEADAVYSSWNTTSDEFIEQALAVYRRFGKDKLPPNVWNILKDKRPEVAAPAIVELSKLQQNMLNRAVEFVSRMGHNPSQYTIIVAKLQKNTLGTARDTTITLSPELFNMGTKALVSTLLEETIHLETGLDDCNYEMQTYLFNRIVSLYEEHVFGEAC